MRHGLDSLTDREKATLRLLLVGHDAKSIAAHLGLSVHTVNERLRDARRKLEVSSSREAARLLAESERDGPHFLGDKEFGVSAEARDMPLAGRASPLPYARRRLAWILGGILIMSLMIAAVLLASLNHGAVQTTPASAAVSVADSAAHPAGLDSARDWVGLLDRQQWNESWDKASSLFQAGVSASQWVAQAQAVRQPLGAVSGRSFRSVMEATSLPGAPVGQYEIIEFQTGFENKAAAVETVVIAREAGVWKVAGYFIR